jgi:hypothetical protein
MIKPDVRLRCIDKATVHSPTKARRRHRSPGTKAKHEPDRTRENSKHQYEEDLCSRKPEIFVLFSGDKRL